MCNQVYCDSADGRSVAGSRRPVGRTVSGWARGEAAGPISSPDNSSLFAIALQTQRLPSCCCSRLVELGWPATRQLR